MSRMAVPEIPHDRGSIASRLESHLGLGTDHTLRRALYTKLQNMCEQDRGSEVLEVIDAVIGDASDKADPGRYFAYVVLRRLAERGLTERKRVEW